MNEPILNCPHCKINIRLTESLAAPLLETTRKDFESRMARKEEETAAREEAAKKVLADAQKARAETDAAVAAKLDEARAAIAAEEAAKARQATVLEIAEKDRSLVESLEMIRQQDEKLTAAHQAQADLLRRERELTEAKGALELSIGQKVKAERDRLQQETARQLAAKDEAIEQQRGRIEQEAAERARQAAQLSLEERDRQLAAANDLIKERETKLAEAQASQVELLKRERALRDAQRELELTVEKRVGESLDAIRLKARQEAEDGLKLTITERDEQIAGMKRQIEDLKRRAEQGSQQLQGEAFELELESLLRARFPTDTLLPVAKGEFGGDIVQTVMTAGGMACGQILWETKRTKTWSDGWLSKLRDDQRRAGAELAILISDTLPKGCESFDLVEGVWVTGRACAIPVAISLRQGLVELQKGRQVQEGQQTKMEMVYAYLTGPRFRHRIEAIVEKFTEMQADLARERRSMTKMWSKRELQIHGVIEATVGMYGDMQGIAGRAMQEIPALEMPLLTGEGGSAGSDD